MSIGKIIMSFGKTFSSRVSAAPKKLVDGGAVAVKDVLARKVDTGATKSVINELLHLPAADEFIKSAGKQEATIISDNFVRFKDYPFLHRVITKRFPTGTTVAKAYNEVGHTVTEVISEKGFTRSINSHCMGIKGIEAYGKNQKGGFFKPALGLAKDVSEIPLYAKLDENLVCEPMKGSITAFSNANNKDYLDLLRMGLINKVG